MVVCLASDVLEEVFKMSRRGLQKCVGSNYHCKNLFKANAKLFVRRAFSTVSPLAGYSNTAHSSSVFLGGRSATSFSRQSIICATLVTTPDRIEALVCNAQEGAPIVW